MNSLTIHCKELLALARLTGILMHSIRSMSLALNRFLVAVLKAKTYKMSSVTWKLVR